MSRNVLPTAAGQRGFTLVELLIVVIILAILAAIVVPQFTASTSDAKEAAIDSTLQNMRSAVDLYRQQHDAYTADGADVTDQPGSLTTFWDQMLKFTDTAGAVSAAKNPAFPYGPYLRKKKLPQVKGSDALVISNSTTVPLDVSAGTGGWIYSWETGQFLANHPDYQDR